MADREPAAAVYGVAAEYATEWQIVEAATRVRERGLGRVDAFTPLPIPALTTALRIPHSSLPIAGGVASALGVCGFFATCVYATMAGYDFLIGGRPAFSWAYFVIPSVSIGMLAGAAACTLGMLFLNRLPQLNHPAFNIEGFERASQDGYILVVEARDRAFDADAVAAFLRGSAPRPLRIQVVPR